MAVRIKLARGAGELDEVYQLRHRVFAEQEGLFRARADGRVTDDFDSLAATRNVVAVQGDKVVGALRLTLPSDAGLPTDGWWDFGPALSGARASAAAGGMLCVDRSCRGVPRLVLGMLAVAHMWLRSQGISHVIGLFNPKVAPLFEWVGARRLAGDFQHRGLGLPVAPMVLDLEALTPSADAFIRAQQIEHFLRSCEREFVAAGEPIIQRGDRGDSAYVVISGRVLVRQEHGEGQDSPVLAQLGRGAVFGELAPLTDGPRTADVVAGTDSDLMVIGRDALLGQVAADPVVARGLLEVVAQRLASRCAISAPELVASC